VVTAAGAAIGATVTAVGALVQATTSAVVETDNYAQAVGISTEAMQAFDFAAQRVGGDTDALRESLRTSQDAIAQFANDGTGPAAEALELFGLQLTDSSGKVRSMEQLLPELVTALGSIQDPAERSRLAIQLFGEEDSRVMLAMANNPKILQESRSALEQYGLVMGKDLVQQSRTFQTGVTDLMASLQGLAQEIVSALLPTLNALLPQFTAWVVSLRESDTVQKELIPTLQAIIGYLGNVGIAVDVLKAGWAALNAGFNAAVMVILEGVGKVAQGLGTIISAAGTAADVLGMDGVAAKLQSAGAAVTEVGTAADQMGDIARESMQEWQTSLDTTIANLGQTTTATEQTTTATTELGKAATESGKQVTEASKAMAEETAMAQARAEELRKAYQDLGIKSSEALQKFRNEAIADLETIRQSGTETAERIADEWTELVPTLLDEYGKLPPEFARMDREIMASAGRATTEIQQAYDTLGIETTQSAEETARKQIEAFGVIVAEGKKSIEEQRRLYQEVLVPAIEAATGKMAPSFEVFYGIVKSGATDAGEHIQRVFDATGQAVTTTMSSLGTLLEQLGIQTKEQLRTTAAEAESNLLTIVSIYGVRSKEAAQAFATTIADIKAYHDELPPHIQRIADQIEGSHHEAATESATAYEQAVQQIVQVHEAGFQRINGVIQATAGVFEDSFQAFGNSTEEIRAQIAELEQQIQALQPDPGFNVMPDLSVTTFQTAQLREAISALHDRLRDLADAEREASSSTDDLAESASGLSTVFGTLTINTTLFGREVELVQNRFGEWRPRIDEVTEGLRETTERSNTLSGSLGGVGSAIRDTTEALATMTVLQIALNEAMENSPHYYGSRGEGAAIRQAPSRSGGSGSGSGGTAGYGGTAGGPGGYGDTAGGAEGYGGTETSQVTAGYEASARYRGSRYYSAVIGSSSPQLPVGVPLPSDLGIPQGGTGFPTTRSSLESSMSQYTTVNVNEPITIQTRADSSALTSQAIVDALNEAIRRGILRPELGSGLR
jgi:hypothetical protein